MTIFNNWNELVEHASTHTGDGSAKAPRELWSAIKVLVETLASAMVARNALSTETNQRIKDLGNRIDKLEARLKKAGVPE